jgi:hypothetical protein
MCRAQLPITAPGGASACIVPMLLAAKAGMPRGSRRLEHVRVHVPHDGTHCSGAHQFPRSEEIPVEIHLPKSPLTLL